MTITALRVPEWVHEQAVITVRRYRQRRIQVTRIKCGNISLKVNRRWRLLSRDGGRNWIVMSHETYNGAKDRK